MITCPWCGTNYTAFQPNCKNCGGPLPMPAPAPKVAEIEEDILMPPPAPRAFPDSYIWKLVWREGWGIAAMVFAILGSVFSCLGIALTLGVVTAFVGVPFVLMGVGFLILGGGGIYWRYTEAEKIVNVLRVGQAARGEILTVEENLMVEINNRHPWVITYAFSANGQNHEGKVTTLTPPGPQLQPGKSFCVLYLPEKPALNALYPHP